MKKMTIKEAVEYNWKHDVAIHVPKRKLYDKLVKYLDSLGYMWHGGKPILKNDRFNEENDLCIKIYDKPSRDKDVSVDGYSYFNSICTGGVVELVDEGKELTITIKSDGHKIITAECNGIKVQASCNDSDVFSNVGGSHLAINRLFNALDKKAKESTIEKGDIVEVVKAIHSQPKDTIGLQGVVTASYNNCMVVEFPVKINGDNGWGYAESELKLIRKG